MPDDRIIDGADQTQLLLGKSDESARTDYFYFCKSEMHGVRMGKWKLLLPDLEKFYGYVNDRGSGKVELYDLDSDIGEKTNLAAKHPEVVEEMVKYTKSFGWPEKPAETSIGLPRKKSMAKPSACPRSRTLACVGKSTRVRWSGVCGLSSVGAVGLVSTDFSQRIGTWSLVSAPSIYSIPF